MKKQFFPHSQSQSSQPVRNAAEELFVASVLHKLFGISCDESQFRSMAAESSPPLQKLIAKGARHFQTSIFQKYISHSHFYDAE